MVNVSRDLDPPPVSGGPEPEHYLVFISANHEVYLEAQRVHSFLTAKNRRPFFCRITLPDIGVSEYGRVIDNVLQQVEHLVVVASHPEHLTTRWVEHEWRSFHEEKLGQRKHGNLVTVLCGNLQVHDLPMTLRRHAAISRDDLDELLRYLSDGTSASSPLPASKPAPQNPLHDFPAARRVPDEKIPTGLIRAYADVYREPASAIQLLREANEMRAAADPAENPARILISLVDLPAIGQVAASTFWTDVWLQATRKGARMVAALLLAADEIVFSDKLHGMRSQLLDQLRQMNNPP